jgi:hypothetical protein
VKRWAGRGNKVVWMPLYTRGTVPAAMVANEEGNRHARADARVGKPAPKVALGQVMCRGNGRARH